MGRHLTAFMLGAGLVAGTPALADEVAVFSTKTAVLALTPDDMEDAAPQFGGEGAGLSFILAPAASKAFADLTESSVGQMMTLTICGDVLVEAVIRGRLEGRGYVALDSLGDANWYASRMTGEAPCDGTRDN